MRREPVKPRLRPSRGLAALAIMAVAPKCAVCVAGYLGLGAWFGLGGPEICGAVNEAIISLPTALFAAGACLFAVAAVLVQRKFPGRSSE